MMLCPKCGCERHKVVDTVLNSCTNEFYRKCLCADCSNEFFTVEFEADNTDQFKKDWNKYHRSTLLRERLRTARFEGGKFKC